MSHFNLIDKKWIPVRLPDGSREELGIRDTLLRANEIAVIEDASPLVVAALHRFLLAVLYRSLKGPTDIKQAKALFREGLPSQKISDYLEKWRDRFWLFDEGYPFGQNPKVPIDKTEPWTKLSPEYNATSNKVLFDHTDTTNPGTKSPKECARWLISTMSFSISGGRGYYPSPSPNAMMCLPLGKNLEETLCYSLVPYQNREVMKGDSALWERKPELLPLDTPKQIAHGYADLYTWQARMICLEELPSGQVAVARFVSGKGFNNASNSPDPMQAYKADKTHGKLPIQFRENRGTWRDFDSLLPDDADFSPLTIQNAIRLSGRKVGLLPKSILVVGLRYSPPSANVDFWRMERFSLPGAMANNLNIRTEIRQLLNDAEDAQQSLWLACRSFARDLLARGAKEPDKKNISKFIGQMSATPWYWSELESHFHETLWDYHEGSDPDDIRYHWLKSIRKTLQQAWDQHADSISTGDAWAIRALIKAEKPMQNKYKELNIEIQKLAPQEAKA